MLFGQFSTYFEAESKSHISQYSTSNFNACEHSRFVVKNPIGMGQASVYARGYRIYGSDGNKQQKVGFTIDCCVQKRRLRKNTYVYGATKSTG